MITKSQISDEGLQISKKVSQMAVDDFSEASSKANKSGFVNIGDRETMVVMSRHVGPR